MSCSPIFLEVALHFHVDTLLAFSSIGSRPDVLVRLLFKKNIYWGIVHGFVTIVASSQACKTDMRILPLHSEDLE